jgi:type IV pilus assembly protein PilC
MKTYFFKAYNIDRKKVSSTLEFNSAKEFHRYLNKNRLTLISYKIITPKYKITQENILIFTQNLKTLLDSGLTISLVLDILSTQEKDIQFSKVIKNIRDKILNGNSIYSAFYDYNTIFGDTYLNLLLAGEESGELVENLDKICEIISLKEKIKKNIKEALFYPAIVFVFTIFLLIFMLTFVFPNFISLFQDTNTTLPLLTKIIIFLSQNIFYILLILSILILFFIKILKKLPLEKYQSFILNLPFYGKIIKKNLIISLCQNFSIMNKAGINIIDILETLKKATPYIFLQKELQKIQIKIKIGNTIEEAFSSTNLFSSTEIKTISIGERTGRLSEAFSSISFILQKDLESYLFKLTTLLQPFLLLILGIIIGIIVLAIYLPIFNITDLII